ncbi:MAG: outer membrane beta-barrel domain-containing protein [Gammaproteobacteria bacterium]|nr:outer membrane beta-barrel domain-containing protein [Gammaproteobacteria bacterium]MDH3409750.1 outer membrane beta-barrel domain-containing protein [Gammaproteobacteria bacterium]MDH3552949.1 outer membrane beta-barrel domain-containing protein [Gammaproteobacteria bacterium]
MTLVVMLSGCAATKNLFGIGDEEAPPPTSEPPGQVIDPQVERREIKEPAIDREDFEIGAFAGIMNIEDFGSDTVYGVRLAYHVTEGFFVEATVGQSEASLTSFEILSGGARLFDDRDLIYYNLNLGYNVLPGEVFIGEGRAYNTNFYLIAGLGSTRFADDDRFTVNFGAGFRFLLTDSVAIHVDFRDHLFDSDVLGREKTVHNLEGTVGVTVFF